MNTKTQIAGVVLQPLTPSQRGKLGGRKPGCKGRQLTTEQARATVKARWDKYRATKTTKKGNQCHLNYCAELRE